MWSRLPSTNKGKTSFREPFDCDVVCRDGKGEFHDDRRAERGCRRLDLPIVEDRVVPYLVMQGWMGRDREPGLHSISGRRVNWQQPLEDPADGCPGSWTRCRFVLSLLPFIRRRCEGGNRVPNRLLDEADDLIWQWVQIVEEQQERWQSHVLEESLPKDQS